MKRVKVKTPTLALNVYALLERAVDEGLEFVWVDDATVRRFEYTEPFPEGRGPAATFDMDSVAVVKWYEEEDKLSAAAAESTADAVLEKISEIANVRELPVATQKRIRDELIGMCWSGWRRAHKHVEKPNVAGVRDAIANAILLEEIFNWETA
jgi:hypothetical protein